MTKSDSVETMSLEGLIKAYAEKRCGIYTCNNEFARQLHRIARKYEECDYNRLYEVVLIIAYPFKYLAVTDSLLFKISVGFPANSSCPPASPPSGPTSMR